MYNVKGNLVKICLFSNSYQPIEFKGLKFSGFDGHSGVVIRKFVEDPKKHLCVGLLRLRNFLVVVTTLCLSKTSH